MASDIRPFVPCSTDKRLLGRWRIAQDSAGAQDRSNHMGHVDAQPRRARANPSKAAISCPVPRVQLTSSIARPLNSTQHPRDVDMYTVECPRGFAQAGSPYLRSSLAFHAVRVARIPQRSQISGRSNVHHSDSNVWRTGIKRAGLGDESLRSLLGEHLPPPPHS